MTSYKIIIIHGTCGSPKGNWFPWLAQEMSALRHDVSVPKFPTPVGQSFDAWREIFQQNNTATPEKTILVGHSIGAPFIFRLAEEASKPFKALLAVCPFTSFLGNEEFDNLNKTFVDHSFDWKRIKAGASKRVCFAGDNDPYVPLAMAKKVAEDIDAEMEVVSNGGHLNSEFGYEAFPLLLKKIRTIL